MTTVDLQNATWDILVIVTNQYVTLVIVTNQYAMTAVDLQNATSDAGPAM